MSQTTGISPAPLQSQATIRLLPAIVANAIAAGEVVDRPAAVLRELIDNARDAGATAVRIAIDGAGLERVSVADDGTGIEAADIGLAVARHATSKIRDIPDLETIATLGFRGEALASIAAVSELSLQSRTEDGLVAKSILVRGGFLEAESETQRNRGTTVEVRDLFFNTPARKRFLRTSKTETAVCQRLICDSILAAPHIAFECAIDGRTYIRNPGSGLEAALEAVYHKDFAELMAVEQEQHGILISGAISQPRTHKPTRHGLVITLNGRRIYNPALLRAIDEGYRGLLPQGRYPFGLLSLEMNPAEFDVNVHPAKKEVRFRDESSVFTAVSRACWSLTRAARVVVADGGGSASGSGNPYSAPLQPGLMLMDGLGAPPQMPAPEQQPSSPTSLSGELSALAPLQALAQIDNRWLVASHPGTGALVLVDPHAAHEKILYTSIKSTLDAGEDQSRQLLLLPAVIECAAEEMAALEQHGDLIAALGFEVDIFGEQTLRCTAVPDHAAGGDAGKMVRELLQILAEGKQEYSRKLHRMAASIACHSAVRFGDALSPAAQQRLLEQLPGTPGGATCPHGRPTVVIMTDSELRRLFGRP